MMTVVRHLLDNLGSVILAVLLSFAVWIAATLQVDPFATEVFSNVPIEVINQPEGSVIFEPIAEFGNVEARAAGSVLRSLNQGSFEAIMDLAGVELGQPAPVEVDVTCTNPGVRVLGFSPQVQTVYLEAVDTITVPVTLALTGEPAVGYEAGAPNLDPARVVIQGPVPYLRDVVTVTASLDIGGAKEDVVQRVAVTPLNSQGQVVTGVQWSPDRVLVEVRVLRKVGFKPDVEVVPDLRVTPAEGYRLGNVEVDPSIVTLKGPPAVLLDLPGFVRTMPITATDTRVDLVKQVPLTVPVGIDVISADFVTVTVQVLPIQSGRTITSPVEIRGVPEGWQATFSPAVVDVILEGPDALLAQLQPGDIQVLLNLYDYSLGIHRVAPIVLSPGEVTVVSVIPETIEVVLEESPPTDVPTGTLELETP